MVTEGGWIRPTDRSSCPDFVPGPLCVQAGFHAPVAKRCLFRDGSEGRGHSGGYATRDLLAGDGRQCRDAHKYALYRIVMRYTRAMKIQDAETGRAMARARWGSRPRMVDRALDRVAQFRSELAPDQVERLRELAADDKEK